MAEEFSANASAEVGKFPLYNSLLSRLKEHFDEDRNPIDFSRRLEKKHKQFKVIKVSYLCKKALHDALVEVTSQEAEEGRFQCVFAQVQKTLMLSECVQGLRLTPTQAVLGLSASHMDKLDVLTRKREISEELVRALVLPRVENHLQQHCKFLAVQRDGGLQHKGGDKLLKAKATQLAQCIQEDILSHSLLDKELETLVAKNRISSHEYVKELSHALSLLEDLVVECRTGNHSQYNRTAVELMRARYHALSLKISVLHNQVLIDAYTKENNAALQAVHKELSVMDNSLSKQLAKSTGLLRSYQCMGDDFVRLAASYAQILASIENEKWALKEIDRMQQL